jgi:glucose-1-phosphatase
MERTIFFDLGNVLIFFDHQKMCRQVAHVSGTDLKLVEKAMRVLGDPYEHGHINSQDIYNEICHLAQKTLDFDAVMRAISDIFEPNEPVLAIAKTLKERGHRLFLLSNTCEAHFAFASSQFPLLKDLDGHVLSYLVGARKPEKAIYEKALAIAGCKREDCFYTDDISPYVDSARSLGIDAEHYTTPQALTQHLQARGIL